MSTIFPIGWSASLFDSTRKRVASFLLIVFISGMLGLGLLVFRVWDQQFLTVRSTLLTERQHALALLGSTLDGQIQTLLAQSFRHLFQENFAFVSLRITAIKKRFPPVEQGLRFDSSGNLVYCLPGIQKIDQFSLWLSERLSKDIDQRDPEDISIGSFMEPYENEKKLFAYAPIPSEVSSLENSWIVFKLSPDRLFDFFWEPLKEAFVQEHGGQLSWLNTPPTATQGKVLIPVSRHLPGWTLVYTPDSSRLDRIAHEQNLFFGILLAGLGVLPLLAGGIYWWTMRSALILAQAKADFASSISHELKNPISLIRMFAETLEMGRIEQPELVREYLQTIIRESDRLTDMIEQILDFSSLELRTFQYHLNSDDITQTVRDVLTTFQTRANLEKFRVESHLPDSPLPFIHDHDAIRRVLLNLLDNAVKYSLEFREIHITLEKRNNAMIIAVRDRGKGIDGQKDEQLMRPFVRAQDEYSGAIKGAGLGLATANHAVKAHGGTLQLLPRKKGGTLAQILFPLDAQIGKMGQKL